MVISWVSYLLNRDDPKGKELLYVSLPKGTVSHLL